ncbi:MAG: TetR/AcrR family transcriptional regulator [Actinobacteria bacterium]|nr:TetR/AcrR family transcriptional regulator [Actinomycetota bacterium]
MPRDGTATRTSIMDAAEQLILERGFAGTPIDDVLAIAGVTKGAFFHHFASKQQLAHALVERYAALDLGHLEDKMRRAEELSTDPLQQLLVFVGLFREEAAELTQPYPGCLMGSYCYEAGLFDEPIMDVIASTMRTWRERLTAKLEEVADQYPPRRDVDLPSLAEQITVVFEGAYIVSKVRQDPAVVAQQLQHHRTFLELLFTPEDAPTSRPAG